MLLQTIDMLLKNLSQASSQALIGMARMIPAIDSDIAILFLSG